MSNDNDSRIGTDAVSDAVTDDIDDAIDDAIDGAMDSDGAAGPARAGHVEAGAATASAVADDDASTSAQPARRVILVVEDDPYAARLIVRALRDEPTQVEVAGDAREAIAILSRAEACVILMDVKLPGTDGVALTTLLKANPTLRDIPIVMVTGDATRETLTRSISAGAAGFIVKPFDRAALLAKLSPYLS